MLHYLPFISVVIAGMWYAVKASKLTVPAAISGLVIACMIFWGASYIGLGFMVCFFLGGTLATSFRNQQKVSLGVSEENKGVRNAWQVWANAGWGGGMGILIKLDNGNAPIYFLLLACVFSSAIADTLSSELGNVFGSKYYNIVTFKTDIRGQNGVVSREGTLIGLAGSCLIAVIYGLNQPNYYPLWYVIVAGFGGNLFDSLLGATLERKGLLDNNAVNFLNTVFASFVGLLLILIL